MSFIFETREAKQEILYKKITNPDYISENVKIRMLYTFLHLY